MINKLYGAGLLLFGLWVISLAKEAPGEGLAWIFNEEFIGYVILGSAPVLAGWWTLTGSAPVLAGWWTLTDSWPERFNSDK